MCTCEIADWRDFRLAFELTQQEFADLLGINRDTVKLLEQPPHRCPPRSALIALRLWLCLLPALSPWRAERLARAGYPVGAALLGTDAHNLRTAATELFSPHAPARSA